MPSAGVGGRANEDLQQLRRFREFIDTLKTDLHDCQSLRDRVWDDIRAFEELKENIVLLQQESFLHLHTLVHLGCGIHGKARVPSTTRIFVDVGLGFHAECTLSEACQVADARLAHLRQVAEGRSHQVAALKARITLMEQGVQGLEQGEAAGRG